MRIIVESGLLYTTLVLVTFGTELAGSNAVYGVSDVVCLPSLFLCGIFDDHNDIDDHDRRHLL